MAFKFLNSLTRITNIESAVGPEPEWTNRDLTYRDEVPVRSVAGGRRPLANGWSKPFGLTPVVEIFTQKRISADGTLRNLVLNRDEQDSSSGVRCGAQRPDA
jgi:hypothetical protein